MLSSHFYTLILVTNRLVTISDYLVLIKQCALAGITAVQLREKNTSNDLLFEFGSRLKEILDPFEIPLILNDHIDLAKKLDAAGVHLGQQDADVNLAREILGPSKIIGLSIENLSQLDHANRSSLNYVAASAVMPTKNKNNIKKIWGMKGVSQLREKSQHPLVAIGGINENNVEEVLTAGAQGIAVISAIHDSKSPISTITTLRQIIDTYNEKNHV